MAMNEKEALINELTIELNDKFNIKTKDAKYLLTNILQRYHVTISDEAFHGQDLTTPYLMKKFCNGKLASGMSETTVKQYKIAVDCLERLVNQWAELNRFVIWH